MSHGGWNPSFGYDSRGAAQQQPYQMPYAPGPYNPYQPYYQATYQPGYGYHHQPASNAVPVFPNQVPRMPTRPPVGNPDVPALNMTNSTGGLGAEPGYNYFFPATHTKLHVIKSSTAPWKLEQGQKVRFGAYHVPTSTTIADLLKGFGATNPLIKLNRVTEVTQGGGGKWYKGISIAGDQLGDLGKTLKDVGWDETRGGGPGAKPVVWVWITKG